MPPRRRLLWTEARRFQVARPSHSRERKRPRGLEDEPITEWWSMVRGCHDYAKHILDHNSRIHALVMTISHKCLMKWWHIVSTRTEVNFTVTSRFIIRQHNSGTGSADIDLQVFVVAPCDVALHPSFVLLWTNSL